jgi:DNA-binding winged helix-turn-helix (wHTH) protein
MAIQSDRVQFGGFELNLRSGELVSNEPEVAGSPPRKVLLREQPFRILRILIEHRGKTVTRDEIKKVLWANDTIVDFDRSINVAMAILRKAVNDDAENPRYIETLPRRGYRLIVPVEWQESTSDIPKEEDAPPSTPLPARRIGGLIGKRFHEKAGPRQVLFFGPGSPMRPIADQPEARYHFQTPPSWKCFWPFLTSPTADSPCFHSHS